MTLGIPGALRRIAAVAHNTFIEASRNRAFIGLGIAAVMLVVSSMAVSGLAVSDQMTRVLVDFGLFAISFLEVVIAITMGVILVFKEIERKTFYVVLSKSIRRWEVLAGKFAGLLAVLAVALVLMGVAWAASLLARGVTLRPDMIKALILVWMEAALLTSVALFFSAFASPILSGVFTFGMFVAGSTLSILGELLDARKGALVSNAVARGIAQGAVAVLPDLSVFNVGKELILGIPVGWDYVAGAGLYCAGYCLAFGALAALVFERRDFA